MARAKPTRTMKDRGFVRASVMALLAETNPLSPTQIAARMPGTRLQSVHSVLQRLVCSGEADCPERGLYRLTGRAPRAHVPAKVARAWVSALPAGTCFDIGKAMAETGCNRNNVDMALTSCVAAGLLVRVGRGSYRRPGDDLAAAPPLSLTGSIRRLMGSEDRAWHHGEVRDRLASGFPRFSDPRQRMHCLWQMNNMARDGDLERVRPGMFRLLRRQPEPPTVPQEPSGLRAVAGLLARGGLWLPKDLAEGTGLRDHEVHHALLRLATTGEAVETYRNQWRAAAVAVDPVWDSRTLGGAILGVLLRGGTWRGVEVARALNSEDYLAPTIHHLIEQGLVEKVSFGRYRCAPGLPESLLPKFAAASASEPASASGPVAQPEPSRKPVRKPAGALVPSQAQADLDARVLEAMARRGFPVRKVDLAAFSGIDGAVVSRAIRRLVAQGRVREAVPGRFRVAA